MAEKVSDAQRLYRDFHGHAPRRSGRATARVPRALVCLGEAVEIVYRCYKLHGGGDGRRAGYSHKFGRGDKLYTDETGRVLYVIGPSLKVKTEGIVN